jgi:DNA mismatch repair protein MutL
LDGGISALVLVDARPELRVLAQLDDTFVLATDGRALVLVDQHAAHERVAFEAISQRAREGAPVSEQLLVPYVVELEAEDAERFERSRDALASAGLDAEAFGERTFRIVATPAGYGARRFDLRAYVADLADEVAGLDARERVWASLACHSVARAGEPLERGEMEALLARLVLCENPMHCPHGRPTIVRIEPDAVARMFKRS